MADGWQKPAQYCKAVILQLKVNLKKKMVVQGFAKQVGLRFFFCPQKVIRLSCSEKLK